VRAGGSGSRGPGGFSRRCQATGDQTGPAGRAGEAIKTMRAERVGQDIWQPVRDGLLGVGGRFIVAIDAGPPRRRAGKLGTDRWRGRSDCGGVHEASENPAAQAATLVPVSAGIPWPPRAVDHPARPTCGSWNIAAAAQGPVWRDQLLDGRLYTI
jgi:hypothetical protein